MEIEWFKKKIVAFSEYLNFNGLGKKPAETIWYQVYLSLKDSTSKNYHQNTLVKFLLIGQIVNIHFVKIHFVRILFKILLPIIKNSKCYKIVQIYFGP